MSQSVILCYEFGRTQILYYVEKKLGALWRHVDTAHGYFSEKGRGGGKGFAGPM